MPSRIAKNPIKIPTGTDVKIVGQEITVKGKLGEMVYQVHPMVSVIKEEDAIKVAATKLDRESNFQAGTTRALINNMVAGVSEGFTRKLVLIGVGYRAKAQGQQLNLTVGLSHPVNITMPEGVTVETPSNTEIVLKGRDKQLVSQVAANIRDVRPPEPYKGKGIRYDNEQISLKEGKKK